MGVAVGFWFPGALLGAARGSEGSGGSEPTKLAEKGGEMGNHGERVGSISAPPHCQPEFQGKAAINLLVISRLDVVNVLFMIWWPATLVEFKVSSLGSYLLMIVHEVLLTGEKVRTSEHKS